MATIHKSFSPKVEIGDNNIENIDNNLMLIKYLDTQINTNELQIILDELILSLKDIISGNDIHIFDSNNDIDGVNTINEINATTIVNAFDNIESNIKIELKKVHFFKIENLFYRICKIKSSLWLGHALQKNDIKWLERIGIA